MENALTFLDTFNQRVSSLIQHERTLIASYSETYENLKHGKIHVNLFNLPEDRHRQQRGLGSESANNRFFFEIAGFGKTLEAPVQRVTVKTLITTGIPQGHPLRKLPTKTSTPEKIAIYLADYLSQVALEFPPRLTHAEKITLPAWF
jgi:hypothetical protein